MIVHYLPAHPLSMTTHPPAPGIPGPGPAHARYMYRTWRHTCIHILILSYIIPYYPTSSYIILYYLTLSHIILYYLTVSYILLCYPMESYARSLAQLGLGHDCKVLQELLQNSCAVSLDFLQSSVIEHATQFYGVPTKFRVPVMFLQRCPMGLEGFPQLSHTFLHFDQYLPAMCTLCSNSDWVLFTHAS